MISFAADSHVLYGELYHWPAATWPEGAMLNIYEWDTGELLGRIKQVRETYNVVGTMNEYQVGIGETTYTGRSELRSQPGAIMDYGSLIFIALQRSKTAREAIRVISELMDEYGYYSTGESFSISDPNEVWIMELIGKGGTISLTKDSFKKLAKTNIPKSTLKTLKSLSGKSYKSTAEFKKVLVETIGKKEAKHFGNIIIRNAEMTEKGAVWVALRIPDGYVCAHANQARITTFDYQTVNNWEDPNADVFNAPDVISFAKIKGFYAGEDKYFSFSDVYTPVDFGGARFCEIRVWTMFNQLTEGMDKYWEYVKGHVTHSKEHVKGSPLTPENFANNRMPLWIKPNKKVSVHDMMMFMRDHLEGTELDMRNDIGAGPFGVPYRWRPLTWVVDSVAYCNERATATQQTGFSFIVQSRSWLPDEIGGIYWFGVDDASSSVYVPMYSSITEIPEAYAKGNGAMMEWSDNSAFWIFNQVSNFAYTRYNLIHPEIEKVQSAFENEFIDFTPAVDAGAMKLYKKDKDLAKAYLTNYSVNQGNRVVYEWKKLYQYLFMKFMDGNVKEPDPGKQNPKIKQPGYGEEWYRRIIKETGDQFKVIGSAH
jgi:dipeptidase